LVADGRKLKITIGIDIVDFMLIQCSIKFHQLVRDVLGRLVHDHS